MEDHYRESRPYGLHRVHHLKQSDEYASPAYLFPLTDAGSTMVDPLIAYQQRFC